MKPYYEHYIRPEARSIKLYGEASHTTQNKKRKEAKWKFPLCFPLFLCQAVQLEIKKNIKS